MEEKPTIYIGNFAGCFSDLPKLIQIMYEIFGYEECDVCLLHGDFTNETFNNNLFFDIGPHRLDSYAVDSSARIDYFELKDFQNLNIYEVEKKYPSKKIEDKLASDSSPF